MIALCPTCHTELGKLPRTLCYSLKKNPHNRQNRMFRGFLGAEQLQNVVCFGQLMFENCQHDIRIFDHVLLAHRIVDGEFLLTLHLPATERRPKILVEGSDLLTEIDGFWDIEFRTNYVRFGDRLHETALEIDLRRGFVQITGSVSLGHSTLYIHEGGLVLGAECSKVIGGPAYFSGAKTGIQIGEPHLKFDPDNPGIHPGHLDVTNLDGKRVAVSPTLVIGAM